MKAEFTIDTEKRNVIVQVSDKSDRQIVKGVLNKFDTSIHDELNQLKDTVDLVVIDTVLFNKHKDQLVKLKKESSARLISFLIVCPEDNLTDLEVYKDVADDVIMRPIEPKILAIRIKSLLEKVRYTELILKSKQELLDEFESEWRDMVEQSPDLVQISINGKIEYMNPAGAKIYGANSAREMIGQFVRHPNDDMSMEELNKRIETAQKGKSIPPRVLGIMTQTGKRKFVKATSTPFMYNGKRAVHTVGQDITELMNTQKKLKRTISQKDALLQEVHHRVKNNLAIINGLIELQLDKMLTEESYAVLKATQSRILSISKVHELLYQQDHLEELDAKTYLMNLAEMICQSFSNDKEEIKFNSNVESFYLSLDQAIPCGLMLNELISNSLKHAFDRDSKKKIDLIVSSTCDEVCFYYRDYGKGLDNDFDIKKESNFGMLIIRTLLGQLEADWEQKSDKGFHLKFTFQRKVYTGPMKNIAE